NGTKLKKTTKPNPLATLDGLFYQVMRRSDPHLAIPVDAVEGLVNGGVGFYAATLNRRNRSLLTCGIERLPRHFVARTPKGFTWTRRPEDAQEQLLHCIFHLRMTMAYLAEHPLGKQRAASSTGVAQRLTQLPNRTALVSSAEAAGEIVTYDTPPQVQGAARIARFQEIRAQTKARYCYPRAAIEHSETTPTQRVQAQAMVSAAAHEPHFTRYEDRP